MKTNLWYTFVGVLLTCVAWNAGCQSGLVVHAVEGVVTLDGSPEENVTVTLYPKDQSGNMGFARTDAEGRFRISTLGGALQKGTTLGDYQVGFNKFVPPPGAVPTQEEMAAPNFDPSKWAGLGDAIDIMPKKYREPGSSGYEITVGKGKNVYNFELLSK